MKLNDLKHKVLFIMHMPPPVHGAAMVGKFIHDSSVVNESFDCRYENMMLANNLEDIGKGGLKKFFNLFSQLKRFKRAVKEFQPNLVYITPNAAGGAFYKDFIVVQYIKLCLKKYAPYASIIVHFHNKGVGYRQNRLLDNVLYKKFFKGVKVILLAEVLYEDVKKYVAKENVFICPNGIPESSSEKLRLERNNAVPQILFLSNLIVSKGVIVLLDALKDLAGRGYDFLCNVIGGETEELNSAKFLREIEKRNLQERVVYRGKKYGSEKSEYLEKSDIFVFPTFYYNEAFPLVNIEAMEYKLPIVTTNEGGIPDMIVNGENGLICERENSIALADAIELLINDEFLRVRMGENGYKKFKKEFCLNVFENRFVQILNDALDAEN